MMIAAMNEARRRELTELAAALGVTFQDLSLLQLAMTHTSYANEAKRPLECN